MRIVKVIIGVLAGIYAIAQCVRFILMLSKGAHISAIMGSVTGACIGAAVAIALLGGVFRKNKSDLE